MINAHLHIWDAVWADEAAKAKQTQQEPKNSIIVGNKRTKEKACSQSAN